MEIDITRSTWERAFPLNSRLITFMGIYRYIVDKDGYHWIPERLWEKRAGYWLRRAKYKITLTDGTEIKA